MGVPARQWPKTYLTKYPVMVGDKVLENSEVASNESGSKFHRTPMKRSQNCCCEKAPCKSETPGAVCKRRVVQKNVLMVIGSDSFQVFSPKGVQPNITILPIIPKMRVPMILSDPIFEFYVKWCQTWSFSSAFLCCPNALKVNTRVYQNIWNCNTFLEEMMHFLEKFQVCQYFRQWLYIFTVFYVSIMRPIFFSDISIFMTSALPGGSMYSYRKVGG